MPADAPHSQHNGTRQFILEIIMRSDTSAPSFTWYIDCLPQHDPSHSFGVDIDAVHGILLDPDADREVKIDRFNAWLGQYQPCLFGRMAAKKAKRLDMDICWLDQQDLNQGDRALSAHIQAARRRWKTRASEGRSHGFLVMFNCRELAYARPSPALVQVCRKVADLYLIEHAPVQTDMIYTEAVPLRGRDGLLRLFKGGMNLFYPGAHRTRNHDRRVPGGLLLSINSVGHYANTLVDVGAAASIEAAVAYVGGMARKSIGNGGLGCPHMPSTTWHQVKVELVSASQPRSQGSAGASPRWYSGLYHTDVLIPTDVTEDERPPGSSDRAWNWLSFGYITAAPVPPDHPDYGQFHGRLIQAAQQYDNPWPASAPIDTPNE